jgi:hypothetical protein
MTELASEPEPTYEEWTYAGKRIGKGDKEYDAWLPADFDTSDIEAPELWYAAKRGEPSRVVGSVYRIQVRRHDERVTIYKSGIQYVGQNRDDGLRATLEARHRAASARLRTATLEKSDKRKSALDDVLEPVLELFRKTSGPDRDALLVYVMRKISRAW